MQSQIIARAAASLSDDPYRLIERHRLAKAAFDTAVDDLEKIDDAYRDTCRDGEARIRAEYIMQTPLVRDDGAGEYLKALLRSFIPAGAGDRVEA